LPRQRKEIFELLLRTLERAFGNVTPNGIGKRKKKSQNPHLGIGEIGPKQKVKKSLSPF